MTLPPAGTPTALFSGVDAPSEEDLYKCVHCGFCLQACPTYVETGLETESPRGRIALMKAVNEGRIGITPTVISHWDLCIQCRACEVACPSGVPYGRLIEATMTQVEAFRKVGFLPRLIARTLLGHVLPYQRRLALLAGECDSSASSPPISRTWSAPRPRSPAPASTPGARSCRRWALGGPGSRCCPAA